LFLIGGLQMITERGNRVSNSKTVTALTTSTVVSQAVFNAARVNLTLTNSSGDGTVAWLSFGEEAAANKGIRLGDGDTYIVSADAGYLPSQDQVHAIGIGANATIAIYEELDLMKVN
jgi:hypothetical protein